MPPSGETYASPTQDTRLATYRAGSLDLQPRPRMLGNKPFP